MEHPENRGTGDLTMHVRPTVKMIGLSIFIAGVVALTTRGVAAWECQCSAVRGYSSLPPTAPDGSCFGRWGCRAGDPRQRPDRLN